MVQLAKGERINSRRIMKDRKAKWSVRRKYEKEGIERYSGFSKNRGRVSRLAVIPPYFTSRDNGIENVCPTEQRI